MIDTHETYEALVGAKFTPEQATAVTNAFKKRQDDLVTRDYLDAQLAPIRAQLEHLTWMMRGIGLILIAQIIASWLFGKH